ncbi:MAG: hypothetical protein QXS21_00885 [Thermoproteota archaeon]|nr:hypothetical protein [Candidatus Brockarchaeota archaeon]MBO3768592.1 hypothetical protein [Candidatus Brockarchaeota archaeon]MBO3800968.1 hypothetical protein [Candidatus Brockarchaeota archaeon]
MKKQNEKNNSLLFSELELGWSRRYLDEVKASLNSYSSSNDPKVNEKLALSFLKLKHVLYLLKLENLQPDYIPSDFSGATPQEENFSTLVDSLVNLLLSTEEKSSIALDLSKKLLNEIEQIFNTVLILWDAS